MTDIYADPVGHPHLASYPPELMTPPAPSPVRPDVQLGTPAPGWTKGAIAAWLVDHDRSRLTESALMELTKTELLGLVGP